MGRTELVGAVLALLLVGCPDSRSPGGGGAVPFDALERELAEAYCDLLLDCHPGGGDTVYIRLYLAERAQCVEVLTRLVEAQGTFARLEPLIDRGTVAYDGAAARRCIDGFTGSCAGVFYDGFDASPACHATFEGTVPEGGSCAHHEACAGDAYCDLPSGTCPGTCRPRLPVGAACGVEGRCGEGLICHYPEVADPHCVEVETGPDAAEGEPCGLVDSTETRLTLRACAPGLWCTGSEDVAGVCRLPLVEGSACTPDDTCEDGTLCADGTCTAVTIVRTAGASCDEAALRVCDAFARLQCLAGTCVEITDGREGSSCETGDFGEITCNEGLVCHSDTDTCGAPKPTGGTCRSDSECASFYCDYTTETCGEPACGT